MPMIATSRRYRAAAAAAGAACLALFTPVSAKQVEASSVQLGPPPSWSHFRELAEQTIRAQLIDPDSARFSWPWGITPGYYKPILSKKVYGYISCGLINSRNRMGGYTGNAYFIIVMDNDQVQYSEVATAGGSLLGEICNRYNFSPAPTDAEAAPPPLGAANPIAPDGVGQRQAASGSVTQQAGAKPGTASARTYGVVSVGQSVRDAGQLLTRTVSSHTSPPSAATVKTRP